MFKNIHTIVIHNIIFIVYFITSNWHFKIYIILPFILLMLLHILTPVYLKVIFIKLVRVSGNRSKDACLVL